MKTKQIEGHNSWDIYQEGVAAKFNKILWWAFELELLKTNILT